MSKDKWERCCRPVFVFIKGRERRKYVLYIFLFRGGSEKMSKAVRSEKNRKDESEKERGEPTKWSIIFTPVLSYFPFPSFSRIISTPIFSHFHDFLFEKVLTYIQGMQYQRGGRSRERVLTAMKKKRNKKCFPIKNEKVWEICSMRFNSNWTIFSCHIIIFKIKICIDFCSYISEADVFNKLIVDAVQM